MSRLHQNDHGRIRPRRSAPEGQPLQVCLQCQDRKVKCDGNPNGCGSCERRDFDCSLSQDPSRAGEAIWKPGQFPRHRTRRACTACRKRRVRCSGSKPSCTQCSRRKVTCQYADPELPNVPQPIPASSPHSSHGTSMIPVSDQNPLSPHVHQGRHSESSCTPHVSTSTALDTNTHVKIGKEVAKVHIDALFEYVYPIPCYGFLHRATILQSWSTDSLNPCLLNAICAVAARHVSYGDASRQTRAQTWLQHAESQLLTRLGAPRLSDVEAWVLVVFEQMLSGRFANMLMSMSIVARLAYLLHLHIDNGSLPFILQERRRRLMWSICVAESLYSDGVEEFTSCNLNSILLRLPCNERSFSMGIPVWTEPLAQAHEPQALNNIGLMGHCVRVFAIRAKAQRLAIAITNNTRPLLDCLDAVEEVQQELEAFHNNLPAECQFSQTNFMLRAYTPSRITWLMMHIWWHQTHCDLYRFTIPGFREGLSASQLAKLPHDYSAACWAKCLTHALSVSCILETGDKAGVDIITDPSLAICAFHSARIISRLGQSPFRSVLQEDLVKRLLACSNALEKQAQVYPRSKFLMHGILDLVHDAQKTSGPSIWEAEAHDKDDQAFPTMSIGSQSKLREVYTTYSFTEEFCKFEFQACETEVIAGQEGGNDGSMFSEVSLQLPQRVPPSPSLQSPNKASTYFSSNIETHQTPMTLSTQTPEVQGSDAYDGADCQAMAVPGAFISTTYQDVGDTVLFSFLNQTCQPDLFMDSFCPVINSCS